MTNAIFIDTAETLAAKLERWRDAPWLAVDTEFVREETYYAQLCLVQVGDGQTNICVDALALDLAPLFEFLAGPKLTKVFHSAGQDLELFLQRAGDCPRPLFDTQIAAALLGHGEQLGYAALVERRLGEKVDKSLTRTNWAGRPLPPPALDYAADDVRHLAVLYPDLRKELEQRGRLAWLDEECARMCEADCYRPKPEQAWRGVKGLARLAPEAQHRVARLAAWREEEAIRRNRPRRWILDDIALCQLATRQPQTAADLGGIEGVSAKLIARAGEALLALVHDPVIATAPLLADVRPTAEQRQRIQALLDALRVIAEKEQIAQTLIATRSDIEALAREGAAADIPLLKGWRRAVAGEALLAKGP